MEWHEQDPDGIQFGLLAEEVERVNPALVAHDDEGKPYSVRYEAVSAMLLNEFLKAHRKLEEQQKEIEALRSQLQKVSNQLELIKPATRVVDNPQSWVPTADHFNHLSHSTFRKVLSIRACAV